MRRNLWFEKSMDKSRGNACHEYISSYCWKKSLTHSCQTYTKQCAIVITWYHVKINPREPGSLQLLRHYPTCIFDSQNRLLFLHKSLARNVNNISEATEIIENVSEPVDSGYFRHLGTIEFVSNLTLRSGSLKASVILTIRTIKNHTAPTNLKADKPATLYRITAK